MNQTYMFQWNIPAENQFAENPDRFLNIIATWSGIFYSDNTPIVGVNLVNPTIYDCISVKDWYKAKCQIEKVAQKHFADIARKEKDLQDAFEQNPILQRLQNY